MECQHQGMCKQGSDKGLGQEVIIECRKCTGIELGVNCVVIKLIWLRN